MVQVYVQAFINLDMRTQRGYIRPRGRTVRNPVKLLRSFSFEHPNRNIELKSLLDRIAPNIIPNKDNCSFTFYMPNVDPDCMSVIPILKRNNITVVDNGRMIMRIYYGTDKLPSTYEELKTGRPPVRRMTYEGNEMEDYGIYDEPDSDEYLEFILHEYKDKTIWYNLLEFIMHDTPDPIYLLQELIFKYGYVPGFDSVALSRVIHNAIDDPRDFLDFSESMRLQKPEQKRSWPTSDKYYDMFPDEDY